jgi:hypothetical protein
VQQIKREEFNKINNARQVQEIFLFSEVSRQVAGIRPASNSMGTVGSFPGGKTAEAGSWPLISIQC